MESLNVLTKCYRALNAENHNNPIMADILFCSHHPALSKGQKKSYKIWTQLKRSDSDVDAGVGGSIILDGTGPYKKLKGTECLYAVSFLKEIVFYKERCSISNKLFEELKTQ